MNSRFFRAGYFWWAVVPVTMCLFYFVFGLPHIISSYSWVDEGQGFDPFAKRHYVECKFSGPYGTFTTHPTNGRCEWFKFYRNGGAG